MTRWFSDERNQSNFSNQKMCRSARIDAFTFIAATLTAAFFSAARTAWCAASIVLAVLACAAFLVE